MLVKLEWYEAALAAQVGVQRQLKALEQGNPDKHGFEGLGWSEHIEGAGAELAVAKLMGKYWAGHINVWGAADLGSKVQVRCRSKAYYDLLIRPGDADNHAFVLVTGQLPNFEVHGWVWGYEAKRAEWLKEYGGRPPAYFVPKYALRPMVQS